MKKIYYSLSLFITLCCALTIQARVEFSTRHSNIVVKNSRSGFTLAQPKKVFGWSKDSIVTDVDSRSAEQWDERYRNGATIGDQGTRALRDLDAAPKGWYYEDASGSIVFQEPYPTLDDSYLSLHRAPTGTPDLVFWNSNAIVYLAGLITNNSSAIILENTKILANSNAIILLDQKIDNNSNAIVALTNPGAGGLATLVVQNSNAIVLDNKKIQNNSNSIVALASAGIGALTTLVIQNSNAIIVLDQETVNNSNAIVNLSDPNAGLAALVIQNSNAIVDINSPSASGLTALVRHNSNVAVYGMNRGSDFTVFNVNPLVVHNSNLGQFGMSRGSDYSFIDLTPVINQTSNAVNSLSFDIAGIALGTSNALVYLTRVNSNAIIQQDFRTIANSNAIIQQDLRIIANSNAIILLSSEIANNTAAVAANSNAIVVSNVAIKDNSNAIILLSTEVVNNGATTAANSNSIIGQDLRITANSNALLYGIRNNSNAIVTTNLLVAGNSNALIFGITNNSNALLYGIANNSNAIVTTNPLVAGNSNALIFGITNNSNALLYGIANNSNAIVTTNLLVAGNSNALIFGITNNSNALLYGIANNSNAIVTTNLLVAGNSNALLYGITNNSNALLYGIANNSNAIVTTNLLVAGNSNALLYGITNNSNALVYGIANNSNAIVTTNLLVAGNSNALLYGITNNSNAINATRRDLGNIGFGPLEPIITVNTDPYFLFWPLYVGQEPQLIVPINATINGVGYFIDGAQNVPGSIVIAPGVTLGFTNIELRNFNDEIFSFGDAASNVIFGDRTTVYLGECQSMSFDWSFTGNAVLNGQGNTLDLNSHVIRIASPGTLLIKDVFLKGVKNNNIHVVGNNGTVEFKNVTMYLESDFTVTAGSMQFTQDVVISGTNSFIYATDQSSFINTQSMLLLDTDLTFSYNPSIANRDLIVMEDETSVLYLKGCTLNSTTTGLRLTAGTLFIEHKNNFFNTGAVSLSESIEFGDGTMTGDLTIEILPGSSFDIKSGILNYNNTF